MAFDGCRNTTTTSVPNFPPNHNQYQYQNQNQYQASPAAQDDAAYGSRGQSLFNNPSFDLPENHHTSPTPSSELLQGTQNSPRNLSEDTDCDGVKDFDALVSNILEDGDSLDSFSHTERNSSKFTSIWSPQTNENDLLQCLQSDTKTTEANPAFFPNREYNEVRRHIISKDIKNTCQPLNGFNTSNRWLSKPSNRDMDGYKPLKPPGLPMPSMEDLSAMRESQHLISNDASSSGTLGPLKNIPVQKNGFGHQGKMNSLLLSAYEDHYMQRFPKLYQQSTPQEIDKFIGHLQDLMDVPERMIEQNNQMKCNNSTMTTHSASEMQVKRDLGGDSGPVHREQNGDIIQHTFQGNYSFQGPNLKHFQQPPTSNSASFNPPMSYQGKIMTHGQTPLPTVDQVLNQYSQDQIPLPNKASRDRDAVLSKPFKQCQPVPEFGPWQPPQMQRRSLLYQQDYSGRGDRSNVHGRPGQPQVVDKSVDAFRRGDEVSGLQVVRSKLRSTAGGFVQDHFLSTQSNARLQAHTHNRNAVVVTRHGLPQSNHHYFPQPVNPNGSQRFGTGSRTAVAGNLPSPFLPITDPGRDPRQSPFQMGVNSNANLQSSRPSHACGSGPSYRDTCAFNPNVAFPLGQGAGSMYMVSTPPLPKMKERGGPSAQLHYYLEECCEQLTCLEKERKELVILLNKTFPGKRISIPAGNAFLKMPPHPSRVDRLIVDHIREQAMVVNLLGQLEHLSSFPFLDNISATLDRHYEAICMTQTRRREECTGRQRQGGYKDVMPLAVALQDLSSATRRTRTSLWCALQMAVPQSASVLDLRGDAETPGAIGTTEESGPEGRL